MTRDTARNLVRNSLNEASEKFFKDSELNEWLGITYQRVINAIAEAFEGFFGETSSADLVSGQERYALPDNFKKLQQVRLNYTGTWRIAQRIEKHMVDPIYDYSESYPVYTIFGEELNIKPAPSADAVGGLEIDFIKEPPELTSDTQTWDVPRSYNHLVVYGALADILPKDDKIQKSRDYTSKYEQGVQNMLEQLGSRDDSTKHVTNEETGEDFIIA